MSFVFPAQVGPQAADVGHSGAVRKMTGEHVGRFPAHVFILQIVIDPHIDVGLRGPRDFGIVSVTNGGEGPVDVVQIEFARVRSTRDDVTGRKFDRISSATRRVPVIVKLEFTRPIRFIRFKQFNSSKSSITCFAVAILDRMI